MRIVFLLLLIASPAWAQLGTPSGLEETSCLFATTIYCNNFEDYPTGLVGPGTANEALKTYKNQDGLPAGTGQSVSYYEIVAGEGFSGNRALRWNYPAFDCPGDSQANGCGIGYLNPFFRPGQAGGYRELYFRLYHKWSANFVFSATATKGIDFDSVTGHLQTWYWLLIHSACAGNSMCMINQKTSGVTIPGGGGATYPDVYLANVNGGNFGKPVLDQWYCFEFHIRHSSGPDVADGLMEMWVATPPTFTPVRRWQYPNIVTVSANSFNGSLDFTSDFFFAGFWNGTNGQPLSHPAMNRWADNVIVATTGPIGCDLGSGQATPGTPTGLTVTKAVRLSPWAIAAIRSPHAPR